MARHENVFHTTVGACLQAKLLGQFVLSSSKASCRQRSPASRLLQITADRPPRTRYASLKTHFNADSLLTTWGKGLLLIKSTIRRSFEISTRLSPYRPIRATCAAPRCPRRASEVALDTEADNLFHYRTRVCCCSSMSRRRSSWWTCLRRSTLRHSGRDSRRNT